MDTLQSCVLQGKTLRNQHKYTKKTVSEAKYHSEQTVLCVFKHVRKYYDSQQDLFLGCALFPAWNTSLKIPQSSGNAISWWESWSGYLEVWMSSHNEENHVLFIFIFFIFTCCTWSHKHDPPAPKKGNSPPSSFTCFKPLWVCFLSLQL